ncbi:MAG: 2-dehydropantoate 2-reductase [Acidimicrobiales bacterium]
MKIAILGAGAIGGYVGATLAKAGSDVHLIARGPTLAAMQARGIEVLSKDGSFCAHPQVTGDPHEIGAVDIVFMSVKAYSYPSAAKVIAPLLSEHTAVVTAQNGIPWWYFAGMSGPLAGHQISALDPDGAVSRAIAPHRVLGCVTYCSTETVAPGVIRHIEDTRFSIGEPDGSMSPRCTAFGHEMESAGLTCTVETDIRLAIWRKLMGNIAFNPLSALTGATMAEIARNPLTRNLVSAMMTEAVTIARAAGVVLDVSIEQRIAGAAKIGQHKTSMLMDLEARRQLESDAIMAAPIEIAAQLGVEVPNLSAVHAAVSLLAETRRAAGGTVTRAPRREQVRPSAGRSGDAR